MYKETEKEIIIETKGKVGLNINTTHELLVDNVLVWNGENWIPVGRDRLTLINKLNKIKKCNT